MDTDALLAECAARPDDDAPRLVWADAVGGERGELVVIQCDLARGGLSLAETRARRQRERELLDANATRWAEPLPGIADRWAFRRGFVEAVRQTVYAPLPGHPLARALTIQHWDGEVAALPGLRAFAVGYVFQRPLPRLPDVTAAGFGMLLPRTLPLVHELLASTRLLALRLRHQTLDGRALVELLQAAPDLTALELGRTDPRDDGVIAFAVTRPLRALHLGRVEHGMLAHLPGSAASHTLERLAFDLHGDAGALPDILAALPRLHTLVLAGNTEHAARAVVDAKLSGLRTLGIRRVISPELAARVDEVYGAQLAALVRHDHEDELLHQEPAAMLASFAPRYETSTPAAFVRDDTGDRYVLAAEPADEVTFVGRASLCAVRILDDTVSQRHAAVRWRGGAHELRDLDSEHGTFVDGARIERHRLRDGDAIVVGSVRLRYEVIAPTTS